MIWYPATAWLSNGVPGKQSLDQQPRMPKRLVTVRSTEETIAERSDNFGVDLSGRVPGGFDIVRRGNFPCITLRGGKIEVTQ